MVAIRFYFKIIGSQTWWGTSRNLNTWKMEALESRVHLQTQYRFGRGLQSPHIQADSMLQHAYSNILSLDAAQIHKIKHFGFCFQGRAFTI